MHLEQGGAQRRQHDERDGSRTHGEERSTDERNDFPF